MITGPCHIDPKAKRNSVENTSTFFFQSCLACDLDGDLILAANIAIGGRGHCLFVVIIIAPLLMKHCVPDV